MPAASSAGCFCCKACAGRIICRLFLLQGLCRPLHLPAVFTTRPVPVSFTTGLFLLQTALSCLATSCLPAFAMTPCLLPLCCICPHPLPCAPGSSRVLQGLPCRQPHHGTALAARTPLVCCVRSSRVLQGLPCRQPHHGTALAARAPLVFTALISGGRPKTACEQPATFPVTCSGCDFCFFLQSP